MRDLDAIKSANWLVDLRPEGGSGSGETLSCSACEWKGAEVIHM